MAIKFWIIYRNNW